MSDASPTPITPEEARTIDYITNLSTILHSGCHVVTGINYYKNLTHYYATVFQLFSGEYIAMYDSYNGATRMEALLKLLKDVEEDMCKKIPAVLEAKKGKGSKKRKAKGKANVNKRARDERDEEFTEDEVQAEKDKCKLKSKKSKLIEKAYDKVTMYTDKDHNGGEGASTRTPASRMPNNPSFSMISATTEIDQGDDEVSDTPELSDIEKTPTSAPTRPKQTGIHKTKLTIPCSPDKRSTRANSVAGDLVILDEAGKERHQSRQE